jgi:formate hydrogenlyase subunit 3/multisubunit Na+/H+ antiporter MnhD subunit
MKDILLKTFLFGSLCLIASLLGETEPKAFFENWMMLVAGLLIIMGVFIVYLSKKYKQPIFSPRETED